MSALIIIEPPTSLAFKEIFIEMIHYVSLCNETLFYSYMLIKIHEIFQKTNLKNLYLLNNSNFSLIWTSFSLSILIT